MQQNESTNQQTQILLAKEQIQVQSPKTQLLDSQRKQELQQINPNQAEIIRNSQHDQQYTNINQVLEIQLKQKIQGNENENTQEKYLQQMTGKKEIQHQVSLEKQAQRGEQIKNQYIQDQENSKTKINDNEQNKIDEIANQIQVNINQTQLHNSNQIIPQNNQIEVLKQLNNQISPNVQQKSIKQQDNIKLNHQTQTHQQISHQIDSNQVLHQKNQQIHPQIPYETTEQITNANIQKVLQQQVEVIPQQHYQQSHQVIPKQISHQQPQSHQIVHQVQHQEPQQVQQIKQIRQIQQNQIQQIQIQVINVPLQDRFILPHQYEPNFQDQIKRITNEVKSRAQQNLHQIQEVKKQHKASEFKSMTIEAAPLKQDSPATMPNAINIEQKLHKQKPTRQQVIVEGETCKCLIF